MTVDGNATPGHNLTNARLASIIGDLRGFYGQLPEAAPTTPFEQVLWDNVAYLADDARRAQAFALLRDRVGTSPEAILRASESELLEVAIHGILAGTSAAKLRRAAVVALELGDLETIARGPLPEARRALRRFPGIGEPGVDRILLFSRAHPVPALESNGCRAMQRLGLVASGGSYSRVYRAGTALLAVGLGPDFDRLIEAYRLLRQHGQELCRRPEPLCDGCPLSGGCAHYARRRRHGS